LANSLKCLAAAVTKSNASDVAGKLFSTSVLPSVDRQLPSVVTGSEILPGVIGTVLAGVECSQGSYPLTAAFVKLTSAFIQVKFCSHYHFNSTELIFITIVGGFDR